MYIVEAGRVIDYPIRPAAMGRLRPLRAPGRQHPTDDERRVTRTVPLARKKPSRAMPACFGAKPGEAGGVSAFLPCDAARLARLRWRQGAAGNNPSLQTPGSHINYHSS